MAVVFVSIILGALICLYLYLSNNNIYWQKRGIPCASGALPGIGHMWDIIASKTHFYDCCRKIYNNNKNHSMIGFYNFMTPTLMVIDPELVKTVLQTKFTSFHINDLKVNPKLDPLLANNPFITYGEKWTIGRKRLTFAFSSMRLKVLLEAVKQVCQQLEDYINKKLSKTDKVEMELKDLFARYTGQVVAGAGFGVDGHCFEDEKQQKSFYDITKEIFNGSSLHSIMMTIAFLNPWLGEVLRVKFLPKKIDHFFRTLVSDVMEERRTTGTQRNDFFQLMVELERIENDKFDLDFLASQAVSFVLDGSQTSSSVLSFVGFYLATYSEVQKKLREEIISILAKYDGEITYEGLREMTYMDQVLNETQRMVPMGAVLTKLCTEVVELEGSDGFVYRIEPGMSILIPVHSLHEDPRYWENPDVFDPERFSSDRKHIKKFTFLPFGEGPRACVGIRMALLLMKACLATVLKKYNLELSPKTQTPLKMVPFTIFPTPKGGLWVFIRKL